MPKWGKALACVDIFAGAGGLSLGFEAAGFEILVANDFDDYCAATFRAAHPRAKWLSGPIQEIGAGAFLEAANLDVGELDCLIGGPPCQAFSVYNHQRGMHDERSGLFREYLRIVAGLRPKFVVMENVTGMTSVEEGLAVREIHRGLEDLGYRVEHRILKAEEYGVPQERRRIFFIGSRLGGPIPWPRLTHGPDRFQPYVTVWDAIGDLPRLEVGEGEEERPYAQGPLSEYQKLLREGSNTLFNHVAPYLAPVNRERLKYIPQGGNWRDIPEWLLPAGMRRARRSDHTKRYGRLHPEGLSSTILTKCDPHWGAFFHPTQDRSLTVREAARLQSFPDRIRFLGPRVEQYRQVGNAVPPLLARAVASAIAENLSCMTQALEEAAYAV